jgi:hypothetical protein
MLISVTINVKIVKNINNCKGKGKGKVKVVLVLFLTEHHAMKAYWGVEL